MSILAIRFNKTGKKFQFLNYIINILHIPMNAKLPKLHGI